jgi:hypothetical protein
MNLQISAVTLGASSTPESAVSIARPMAIDEASSGLARLRTSEPMRSATRWVGAPT